MEDGGLERLKAIKRKPSPMLTGAIRSAIIPGKGQPFSTTELRHGKGFREMSGNVPVGCPSAGCIVRVMLHTPLERLAHSNPLALPQSASFVIIKSALFAPLSTVHGSRSGVDAYAGLLEGFKHPLPPRLSHRSQQRH